MELAELILTAMPFVKQLLEVDEIHRYLLDKVLLKLILVHLNMFQGKIRVFLL